MTVVTDVSNLHVMFLEFVEFYGFI